MISPQEREKLIIDVTEQVEIAKTALQKVAELADGKDGNVIFLALHKKDDLDIIVKCAKLGGGYHNKRDAVAE